jgi:Holliday junction resolvasome RuvABC ATP-dependent DNA helicase subunit
VQDIWRQIKDFDVVLPAEVKRSVVEIEESVATPSTMSVSSTYLAYRLLQRIKSFFDGLQEENVWQRFARQNRNKSQIDEYGKSLDEAISDFSVRSF